MGRGQDWTFTVAITGISRLLILRDRAMRHLPANSEEPDPALAVSAHTLHSGANVVDARLVTPAATHAQAAVLICHGIGETVEHWDAVQRLLAQNAVASLVFNYSGYGKSTGWTTPQQCEADAIAAFALLQQLLPGVPVSILGYSLGSGIPTAVARRVDAHKLILCAAYTSLREGAVSIGLPVAFSHLLPAIWTNAEALRRCSIPVLILHGEQDSLFPPKMARELAAACSSSCELIVFPGLTHNGPIYAPELSFWSSLVSRV